MGGARSLVYMNVATFHHSATPSSVRGLVTSPQRGLVEVATLASLYGVYELVRGQGHATLAAARAHTDRIVSTAVALIVYVLFPVAPPRLAGLGFGDTVTDGAHVNLSSDMLGSLYNPFAAVPSLHFGYALLVGVAVGMLAGRRWVRAVGWAYPAVMLLTIVATGNHFFFDAVAGGVAVGAAFVLVKLVSADTRAPDWRPRPGSAVAHC